MPLYDGLISFTYNTEYKQNWSSAENRLGTDTFLLSEYWIINVLQYTNLFTLMTLLSLLMHRSNAYYKLMMKHLMFL